MRRGARHCLPIALGIAIVALGLPLPAFAQDTDEDLLGGFEDDFDAEEIELDQDEVPAWLAALPFGELLYTHTDLSGFVEAGTVFSYLSHRVPNGVLSPGYPPPAGHHASRPSSGAPPTTPADR